MRRILKWLPEILIVTVLGVIAYNLIQVHLGINGPIFALACVAEKGNFFQNLFQLGHVENGEWWYGIGFDFCALALIPVIFYLLVRGSLMLRKRIIGRYRV